MGQYWIPVNLDKKEYIDPHQLGSGLKLWEQIAGGFTGPALIILTAAMPDARGGGDFKDGWEAVGRWAGDRITLVGDYAEDGDLPKKFKASKIYCQCEEGGKYKNITPMVVAVLEGELNGKLVGDGWKEWNPNR